MTYKLICPGCGTYTSAVFMAYADGHPCPHCGSSLNAPETVRSYYDQLPDDHRWNAVTDRGTSVTVYKGGKRPT